MLHYDDAGALFLFYSQSPPGKVDSVGGDIRYIKSMVRGTCRDLIQRCLRDTACSSPGARPGLCTADHLYTHARARASTATTTLQYCYRCHQHQPPKVSVDAAGCWVDPAGACCWLLADWCS